MSIWSGLLGASDEHSPRCLRCRLSAGRSLAAEMTQLCFLLRSVVKLFWGVTTDWLLLGHVRPSDGSGIASVSDLGLGAASLMSSVQGAWCVSLCRCWSVLLSTP